MEQDHLEEMIDSLEQLKTAALLVGICVAAFALWIVGAILLILKFT